MKFNRQQLRDAVQEAINEYHNKHTRNETEYELGLDRNRRAWFMNYSIMWEKAVEHMQRKLQKNEPIVESDLPHVHHDNIRPRIPFYNECSIGEDRSVLHKPASKPYIPQELISLREVLDACTDDEVSSSGLSDMGFGTLRHVVKHLGQEKGTEE